MAERTEDVQARWTRPGVLARIDYGDDDRPGDGNQRYNWMKNRRSVRSALAIAERGYVIEHGRIVGGGTAGGSL